MRVVIQVDEEHVRGLSSSLVSFIDEKHEEAAVKCIFEYIKDCPKTTYKSYRALETAIRDGLQLRLNKHGIRDLVRNTSMEHKLTLRIFLAANNPRYARPVRYAVMVESPSK